MKYGRTKDGRIGIYLNKQIGQCHRVQLKETIETIYDNEIIKQADTIKELCDELVCGNEIISEEQAKTCYLLNKVIYGAIWTNKGLIYVAKMNEKGELELL